MTDRNNPLSELKSQYEVNNTLIRLTVNQLSSIINDLQIKPYIKNTAKRLLVVDKERSVLRLTGYIYERANLHERESFVQSLHNNRVKDAFVSYMSPPSINEALSSIGMLQRTNNNLGSHDNLPTNSHRDERRQDNFVVKYLPSVSLSEKLVELDNAILINMVGLIRKTDPNIIRQESYEKLLKLLFNINSDRDKQTAVMMIVSLMLSNQIVIANVASYLYNLGVNIYNGTENPSIQPYTSLFIQ